MNIIINEEAKVEESLINSFREAVSLCIDIPEVEVSLSFVSLDEIHQLNREYRGVDRPTDVLSFPMFEDEDEIRRTRDMQADAGDEIDLPIGDVVICMDRIKEQAKEFGHTEERETLYLFTHSILHLLGYDHMTEEDKSEMRAREEEVMAGLGLSLK